MQQFEHEENNGTNATHNDDVVLEDAGTFDIQLSIIRLKEQKELQFYIRFDHVSGALYEISPVEIITDDIRHKVITVVKNDPILTKLLTFKIPYSKVAVKFSLEKNLFELTELSSINNRTHEHNLMPCVYNKENSPIEVNVDTVLKKIHVNLNKKAYRNYISSLSFLERELFSKDSIKFYFVDSNDYTMLHSSVTISLKSLLSAGSHTINAPWLPDTDDNSIGIMHSITNFDISINRGNILQEEDSVISMRPQILYKQRDNLLFVQSIMENADNYSISDVLNFYVFKSSDPSRLLTKIAVDKNKLNNFGSINMLMTTNDKVSLHCDNEHLYIEDNDVSTYYKF